MVEQQKQKSKKPSYSSKGERRSSMRTRGFSNKFITDNRHVTPGFTEAERENIRNWMSSNSHRPQEVD